MIDSRLENGHVAVVLDAPHRQRHPDLRIPAAGAPDDFLSGLQQRGIDEFLDNCLSAAACDADHRNVDQRPDISRQSLQSLKRIAGYDKIRITDLSHDIWNFLNDKGSDTAAIKFGHISVAVVDVGLDCKKQSFIRPTQRAAVGEQR